MSNKIEPADRILETYDPNWEARYAAIGKELHAAHEKVTQAYEKHDSAAAEKFSKRSHELLQQRHAAFHAQFRTGPDFAAWLLTKLEEEHQLAGKILAYAELPREATVEQINEWYIRTHETLEEQDFLHLPVGQPDGVIGFQTVLRPNTQRTTFKLSFEESWDFPSETRCTIEQTSNNALVCFHDVRGNQGTSVTNCIESLASGVKEYFLPNIPPQNITFYHHSPAMKYHQEEFGRVKMNWSSQTGYTDPEWQFCEKIPAGIREAERKPYQEPPFPTATTNKRPARNIDQSNKKPQGKLTQG